MPRRRLAAALLIPPPWATEIDGLRRACGDALLDRVAPHITLVSPINVSEADLGAALAVLRHAATVVSAPLRLEIGPAASFHPDSPVLYLAVAGTAVDDEGLESVRDALHAGPLARPPAWPFVPHVTVAQDQPAERLLAGVAALAAYRVTVDIDRIHLLEERRDGDGPRHWRPIADVVVGPRVVVAKGGLALELTTGSLIDPEAVELVECTGLGAAIASADAPPVVVVARRAEDGQVVGVAAGPGATGTDDRDPWVAVDPDALGDGVEGHLVARWHWLADR